MTFSKEMIEKSKTASSAENLLEMPKANGIELSAAGAETYFSFLKDNWPLSDEELEQVAGGKGDRPSPKYRIGRHLWVYYDNIDDWLEVVAYEYLDYTMGSGWEYLVRGVSCCFSDRIYLESNTRRVRETKP